MSVKSNSGYFSLLSESLAISKGGQWCSSAAHFPLIRSLMMILFKPLVKIKLKRFDIPLTFFLIVI
jgi:hypothetical protein